MIDNFLKVILLTPDVMYDITVGDLELEGIFKVFKQYEKLDNISTENLLQNNGRISFIEVSNALFEYIVSKLIIEEGDLKLASHMHVVDAERKIILCLPYKKFQRNLKEYRAKLVDKQKFLVHSLNEVSEELVFLSKFDLNISVDKKMEG